MLPSEIIRKKRDGGRLGRNELRSFLREYLAGRVTEYQMSAFLMAVYFRGMDEEETSILTDEMVHSGDVVDLSDMPGIKVDKHSTGGVGDKVSLILAPMVAACGVPVPMMSGRGLGHTGGTLDKLESIPGFRTNLSLAEYKRVLREVGLVMVGQTDHIAPADRRMYALRDVTGTIESIPLIAGSIMSKKIAEGMDALVLDVKTGRGAFMETEERAIELATTLIRVAAASGKRAVALLSDMEQPLGYAIGNWLEVKECIECLQGRIVPDLMEVTYALGGLMLLLGGRARTVKEGIGLCRDAIENGKAFARFKELVRAQGGDLKLIEQPERYPASAKKAVVGSSKSGFISAIDAREIGIAATVLGAGRARTEDTIDPKAGIVLQKKIGDKVGTHDPVASIFAESEAALEEAMEKIARAFTVSGTRPKARAILRGIVDERGVRKWNEEYSG